MGDLDFAHDGLNLLYEFKIMETSSMVVAGVMAYLWSLIPQMIRLRFMKVISGFLIIIPSSMSFMPEALSNNLPSPS